MQHVLIIGKVWPEPGSSAAGSRTMQLIHLFKQKGAKISFACAAGESEFISDLSTLNIEKYKVEINSVAFDELIIGLQPNLVIFDRFTTEEQFGWRVAHHCPNALRLLDTIDLHCLRLARHKAVKEKRVFDTNDLLNFDVAKREVASIYRCDVSLMVSPVEMELLQTVFGLKENLLHYAPLFYPAIDEHEKQSWKKMEEREHFISIGNFLHEPNWDAVLQLKTVLWPLIRKQLPKAELHVYGAYATQKVFELNNVKEGFIVKGRAESALEVMMNARVCLAPLRFGAGIKGKLLDAMLSGTPSVTNAIGAEGMHTTLPWNGAITHSDSEFATAAVELYQNRDKWLQASENGRQLINNVFNENIHGALLLDKLDWLQKNLKAHRLSNFTGAMLQQQHFAATKYMAMWIEEKNKKL